GRHCHAALRSAQSAAPQHRVFQHPANVPAALLLRHVPHPLLDHSLAGVPLGWPGLARADGLHTHLCSDGDGPLRHDGRGHGEHRLTCHLADAPTSLMEVSMARSRLSHEDAMTLWQARDVYRVQAVLRGGVVLFFGFQVVMYTSFGYWWLGLVAVALQWGLLWCLRWGLRWLGRWA